MKTDAKTFSTVAFSTDSDTCYGLELVVMQLRHNGWRRVEEGGTYSLVSLYWCEQLYDLIRWKRTQWDGKSRIVVGGNSATANPAACFPWADAVWLGDGEAWNGDWEHPSLVKLGAGAGPIAIQERLFPIPYEDIQKARRAFIEISRGCKNKCAFCQYGWLKPYRETELEEVLAAIHSVKVKSVRVFAADRFQHTAYVDIRKALETSGRLDTGSDVSIRFLLKYPEYLAFTHKIRCGIEGMSENLRRFVHKPLTDEQIVEAHAKAREQDIKCFDWYMIYGLPGETDADAEAFVRLLEKLAKVMPGQTLAIHFQAFQPNALTPMQWDAAAVEYPKERLRNIMGRRVPGLKLAYRPDGPTGDATMFRRMLAVRGNETTDRLAWNVAYRPRVLRDADLIRLEFQAATATPLDGSMDIGTRLPTDQYVLYDRDRLVKVRKAMDRHAATGPTPAADTPEGPADA